jgi:hypothetical protein
VETRTAKFDGFLTQCEFPDTLKYFGDDDAMSSDIVFNTEGMLAEFTDTAIDFTESYEDDGCDPEDHNPDSPPIARLLDLIIQELRTLNAERVVITPIGDAASVEFEIDGKMIERDRLPMRVFLILAKRIADGSKESAVRDGIKVKIHESDLGSIIEMRHKLD